VKLILINLTILIALEL